MAWKGIIGSSFDAGGFDAYCHGLAWTQWRPSYIVLHNTSSPTLKQRPNGLTRQHIDNLEHYYRDDQGWSAGPHLFVDDRQIWVFTPLTVSGVHSPSYNKLAFGIEMLGDYETEALTTGRGAQVRTNAIAAMATLCAVVGIDPGNILFHKEDPLTTHKDCPGKNVDKKDVVGAVQSLLVERHIGEHLEG